MKLLGVAVFAILFTAATVAQQSQQTAPQAATPLADKDTGSGKFQGNVEVLTNTEGVDFRPYLSKVLKAIRTNWPAMIPAKARKPELTSGKVSIELNILRDGRVAGMKITELSGDDELDRAAWWSVAANAPFAALPAQFTRPYLALRFNFYYNPKKMVPLGPIQNEIH